MNKLRLKAKINCNTCGCSMSRTKTIKVIATTQEQAMAEALSEKREWEKKIAGQNCKICQSIINDLKCVA